MKILETSRLVLKEIEKSDAHFIYHLFNSPNCLEFLGDRDIVNIETAERYIEENFTASYKANKYGLWKVLTKNENQFIGICGFLNRPFLPFPDLGFAVLPEYEGKGYITEAGEACMQYGMDKLSLDCILALTTEDNMASIHLLDKFGLEEAFTIVDEESEQEFLIYSNREMDDDAL